MRISKRLVLGITIPILILGLGLFLVFAIFKTARVYIMVAPESATITINGKKYKNGEHCLFPGTKTIRVEGEGIESYETQIEAQMFSSQRVAIYRKVNGSYDSYINSKSDYIVLKSLVSEQQDEQAVEFLKRVDKAKNLLTEMPGDYKYTIETGEGANRSWEVTDVRLSDYSSSSNCPTAICILIEAKDPQKIDLREMIEARGYNYDDYYFVRKKINV